MAIFFRIVAIICVFLTLGCASADKLYKKGDYEGAFKQGVKDLLSSKKHFSQKKSLLNQTFKKLSAPLIRDYPINDLVKNKENFYENERRILGVVNKGRRFLTKENMFTLDSIETNHLELKKSIIASLNQQADEILETGIKANDKNIVRDALFTYMRMSNVYDFEQPDKISRALEYGTFVNNFYVDHPYDLMDRIEMERSFDDIVGLSSTGTRYTFGSNASDVDCDVEVDFSRLNESKNERDNSQNYSDEVEDGYETKTDTSGNEIKVPIMKTVRATVHERSETITYSYDVYCSVSRRSKYCAWSSNSIQVSEDSAIKFYVVDGDPRAVPSTVMMDVNREKQRHKSKSDIVTILVKEAYSKVRNLYD
jgi:hypothetical protein